MILTVTPNPSLDLLFTSGPPLQWDDANRVDGPRRRPGGQGINLTRAARALGAASEAIAMLGGRTGQSLAEDLRAEGTPLREVRIAEETRTFVAVRELETGRSMLVNPRGPQCTAQDAEALLHAVRIACAEARVTWVVSSGSTPPGLPIDTHARVGVMAREAGARFVADCDGDALHRAARSGHCDLLAPNLHEAERLTGRPIEDVAAAGRAARHLRELAANVVIKLGEHGAVCADATATWHARPPALRHGSAVGAGDAFLAAFLIALQAGAPTDQALTDAVAAGTATLHSRGATLLDPTDIPPIRHAVTLTRLRE